MSGYSSLRGLSDVMERHYREVMSTLGHSLKTAPTYSTVRRLAHQVDSERVSQCFHRWAQADGAVSAEMGIAIDGKALGSTVTDCHGAQQDFVMVVSACVQEYGWVVAQTTFQNRACSEIEQVRALVQQLEGHGAWLTLDAWHCQKNSHDPG